MDAAMADQQHERMVMGSGRLRAGDVTEGNRQYAVFTHISQLSVFVIGPLFPLAPMVMWLIRREKSVFVDDHGREAFNFSLSMLIFIIALGFLPLIGWVLAGVLWIVGVVNMIRGALAANRSEYFRYPMTIRFLK